MTQAEKLQFLTDKDKGLGMQLNVIAKYTHCHPSSIRNYINGLVPSERMSGYIDEGIDKICDMMRKFLKE